MTSDRKLDFGIYYTSIKLDLHRQVHLITKFCYQPVKKRKPRFLERGFGSVSEIAKIFFQNISNLR